MKKKISIYLFYLLFGLSAIAQAGNNKNFHQINFDDGTTISSTSTFSGIAIGNSVGSGTSQAVLFIDQVGNLNQDELHLNYSTSTQVLTVPSSTVTANLTVDQNIIQGSNKLQLTVNSGGINAATALNGTIPIGNLSNTIFNQNTLQSGATFYVSSGTVAGQLNATGAFVGTTWQKLSSSTNDSLIWTTLTHVLNLTSSGTLINKFQIDADGYALDYTYGLTTAQIEPDSNDGQLGYNVQTYGLFPNTYPFSAYQAEHSQGSTAGAYPDQSVFWGIQYIPGQDAFFFVAPSSATTFGAAPVTSNFVINETTGSANFGNVGINVSTPTQILTVGGNVQFSGALMPNGSAGSSGQLLQSNGAGSAPSWITNSGGGMTPGASYYVQVTNTLQAGATFYVSSGTVAGTQTVQTLSGYGNNPLTINVPSPGGTSSVTNGPNINITGAIGSNPIVSGNGGNGSSINITAGNGGNGSPVGNGGNVTLRVGTGTTNGNIYLVSGTTWTWPTADGSGGYVLQTNGSGVMSWTQIHVSSFSTINASTATTATSWVSTGLKAQITPRYTGSKIRVTVSGTGGASGAIGAKCQLGLSNSGVTNLGTNALASATDVVAGVTGVGNLGFSWLDLPNTTSATTYTVLMQAAGTTPTCTFCTDGSNLTCSILVEDIGTP